MSNLCNETIKKMAVKSNNETWNFFGKDTLSQDEISEMLKHAYTSLNLWSVVGKDIHLARGHWMLSRAFCLANNKEQAILHSDKCSMFTGKASEGKADFDLFYSLEAKSRANALYGNTDLAKQSYTEAMSVVEKIEDKETKDLCISDIKSGPWFGFES
jgi:hypothetical protein